MIAKTLKLLGILFWIVTALFLVVFSVSNRTIIDLSFEPFEFVLPIPTYQILFFGIFIGILITGTSLSWLRLQGFARRRKAERQATNLEAQVSSLSEDLHQKQADEAHRDKGEDALVSLSKN